MSFPVENGSFAAVHRAEQAQKDQLADFLKGKSSYKSQDVPTIEDTIIVPRGRNDIKFAFSPKSLPILEHVPLEALAHLEIAVRSRWAQGGGVDIGNIDGYEKPGKTLANGFAYSREHDAQIATISVATKGMRPVFIPKGTRLFRYFYLNPEKKLIGKDLDQALSTGKVKVDGERGKDWGLVVEDDNTSAGIFLNAHKETHKAVNPFHPGLITLADGTGNFRSQLNLFLGPVTPFMQPQLIIGETSRLTLPDGYNAKLHPVVTIFNDQTETIGYQTNSRLLDGGYDWPIRTETETRAMTKNVTHRLMAEIYRD